MAEGDGQKIVIKCSNLEKKIKRKIKVVMTKGIKPKDHYAFGATWAVCSIFVSCVQANKHALYNSMLVDRVIVFVDWCLLDYFLYLLSLLCSATNEPLC